MKKERLKHHIQVMLTDSMKKNLERVCEMEDRLPSTMCIVIIKKYLEENAPNDETLLVNNLFKSKIK